MSKYSNSVLASNPFGYWRMGEPNGNLIDSISGNDAVPSGSPTYSSSGAIKSDTDKSIQFNGSELFTVPYAVEYDSADFTFECWLKPTAAALAGTRNNFVSRENGANFTAAVGQVSNKVTFWLYYGVWDQHDSTNGLTADQWSHIVLVKKGDLRTIYINGKWDSSKTTAGTYGTNTTPMVFGASAGVGGGIYFNGNMDETAFYTRALSEPEIYQHYLASKAYTGYALAVASDGPIGYWKLDEVSGLIANDEFGHYHGTVKPNTVVGYSGAISGETTTGYNLDIATTNQGVWVTKALPYSPVRTVEAWIKASNSSWYGVIFGFSSNVLADATETNTLYLFQTSANPGYNDAVGFNTWNGDTWGIGAAGVDNLQDGQWHHVVAVFHENAVHAKNTLWIDGVQQTLSQQQTNPAVSRTMGDYFSISRHQANITDNQYFQGQIDEVSVYNYAFTQEIVDRHRKAGLAIFQADTYRDTVRLNDPTRFYRMGDTNTNLIDDVTLTGVTAPTGVTFQQPGIDNASKGILIDGIDTTATRIDLGFNDQPTDFAVEAWVKPTGASTGRLLSKSGAPVSITESTHPDILLHHQMQSVTGNLVLDSSMNGRDGYSPIVPTLTKSPRGAGYQFDGVDDYYTTELDDFGIMDQITIAVWVKHTDTGALSSLMVMGTDVYANRLNIHLTWSISTLMWDFGDINSGGRMDHPWQPAWNNTWTHFTFTAGPNGLSLYANGVHVVTEGSAQSVDFTGKQLHVMNYHSSSTRQAGTLTDLRIYKRELTPAEITEVFGYNPPIEHPLHPNCIGAWDFEHGESKDSSGYFRHATQSSITRALGHDAGQGVIGTAAALSSNSGKMTTPAFTAPLSFTLACWAKLVQVENDYSWVIGCHSPGDINGIRMFQYTAAQGFVFACGNDTQGSGIDVGAGWFHCAVTYDNNLGRFRGYLNGAEVVASTGVSQFTPISQPLYMLDAPPSHSNPNGQRAGSAISTARMYDIELTAQQITDLMNVTKPNILDPAHPNLIRHMKMGRINGSNIGDISLHSYPVTQANASVVESFRYAGATALLGAPSAKTDYGLIQWDDPIGSTFSCWAYTPTGGYQTLLQNGVNGLAHTSILITTIGCDARRYNSIQAGAVDSNIFISAVTPFDQWVHVALTLTPTLAILYHDGVEVGRTTLNYAMPPSLRNSGSWDVSGHSYDSTGHMIDDVRIFTGHVATPAEILELANEKPLSGSSIDLNVGGNGIFDLITPNETIQLNGFTNDQWNHLVLNVVNNNRIDAWVNGKKQSTAIGYTIPTSLLNWHLGAPVSETVDRLTQTYVAEVAFYPAPISSDSIIRHYQKGSTIELYTAAVMKNDPIGYWRLDDLGAPITDYAAGNDATALNVTLGQPKNILTGTGKSVTFDNTSNVTGSGVYDFTADEVSIEAWINPTTLQTRNYIFVRTDTVQGGFEQCALEVKVDGSVQMMIQSATTAIYLSWATAAGVIKAGQPYHVVGVWNKNTHNASDCVFYINGTEYRNNPVFNATGNAANLALPTQSGDFMIGSRAWESGTNQFIGNLDEVALYNYALDHGDIVRHYQAAVYDPYTKKWIIGGTTKVNGVIAPCTVRLYDHSSGELLQAQTSDAQGVYTFPNLTEAFDYDVVVLQDPGICPQVAGPLQPIEQV